MSIIIKQTKNQLKIFSIIFKDMKIIEVIVVKIS